MLPEVLEDDELVLWSKIEDSQYFKYTYKFLHQGIFSRFLIRIEKQVEERIMWRHGIWFRINNSEVLVEQDRMNKSICVKTHGTEAVDLLNVVKSILHDIHYTFQPQQWHSNNGKDWVLL